MLIVPGCGRAFSPTQRPSPRLRSTGPPSQNNGGCAAYPVAVQCAATATDRPAPGSGNPSPQVPTPPTKHLRGLPRRVAWCCQQRPTTPVVQSSRIRPTPRQLPPRERAGADSREILNGRRPVRTVVPALTRSAPFSSLEGEHRHVLARPARRRALGPRRRLGRGPAHRLHAPLPEGGNADARRARRYDPIGMVIVPIVVR